MITFIKWSAIVSAAFILGMGAGIYYVEEKYVTSPKTA